MASQGINFYWFNKKGELVKRHAVNEWFHEMIVFVPLLPSAHKWNASSCNWEDCPMDSKEVLQLKLLAAIS